MNPVTVGIFAHPNPGQPTPKLWIATSQGDLAFGALGSLVFQTKGAGYLRSKRAEKLGKGYLSLYEGPVDPAVNMESYAREISTALSALRSGAAEKMLPMLGQAVRSQLTPEALKQAQQTLSTVAMQVLGGMSVMGTARRLILTDSAITPSVAPASPDELTRIQRILEQTEPVAVPAARIRLNW